MFNLKQALSAISLATTLLAPPTAALAATSAPSVVTSLSGCSAMPHKPERRSCVTAILNRGIYKQGEHDERMEKRGKALKAAQIKSDKYDQKLRDNHSRAGERSGICYVKTRVSTYKNTITYSTSTRCY